MTGLGPADMDANYGPLPSAATRIQVASKLIFPTHALPDAVASGRWWFQLVPRNGPLPPRFGHVLQRPRPLDDDGNPVPWQEF
jgi:hypothetical protein